MKKNWLTLCAILLAAVFALTGPDALAAPASGSIHTIRQPDGKEISVYTRGDEYFHFTADKDGRLIQRDEEGFWHFLRVSGGGLVRSGRADQPASEEDVTSEVFSDDAMKQAYASLTGSTYTSETQKPDEPITPDRVRKSQKKLIKANPSLKSSGNISSIPLVIIVAGFNNVSYSDENDWNEKAFDNKYGITQYYNDMSKNQFTFEPAIETSQYEVGGNTNSYDKPDDGIIHVNLDKDHEDWTDLKNTPGLPAAMKEIVTASSDYIRYSDYDSNNNGIIDDTELAIGFMFAGYEGSTLPEDADSQTRKLSLWAHQGYIEGDPADAPAIDGVTVNKYIAVAENQYHYIDNEYQLFPEGLGTLTHELGHYLGLPDLYDTEYIENEEWSNYDIDDLSLMDGGTDGYNSEADLYLPMSLDAWSKSYLGWEKPVVISKNQDITLNSASSEDYNIAKIDKIDNDSEYYLLENRTFKGWDKPLSEAYDGNGGIIAWHIDQSIIDKYIEDNEINTANHRPAVTPLFVENSSSGAFAGPVSGWDLSDPAWPFYTKSGISDYGLSSIPFVIYGSGSSANSRDARELSGAEFSVLSDVADSMTVSVSVNKPTITPSASSRTLYFAQSATITKKSSSISGDAFASVKNSNSSVASAKISGGKLIVTAKRKAGTAKLTITSKNNATATVKITVKKGTVAKLKKTSGTVKVKKTLKIALSKGSYSGDKIYKCTSSNKKIATVTNAGKITGKKKGKATVTVTLASGATAKFKVTVK